VPVPEHNGFPQLLIHISSVFSNIKIHITTETDETQKWTGKWLPIPPRKKPKIWRNMRDWLQINKPFQHIISNGISCAAQQLMSGYDPIHNWNSIQSLKPYYPEGRGERMIMIKLLFRNVGMEIEKHCRKIDQLAAFLRTIMISHPW
jgi:hypothetical protein